MQDFIIARHSLACVALCAAALTLAGAHSQAADKPGYPDLPPGTPPGYLDTTGLPDSLALLPPPPARGSPAFARDEAAREAAAKLRGTLRWARATGDADLHFPHAAETFSCAANIPISKERTPRLYTLLGRSFVDIAFSTYAAKIHYQRVRPFAMHDGSTCTPDDEEAMRKDGSYPSGHTALGWGWALIMTELVPDHADAILRRGWEFGDSRIVCNVHWQSDVDAGRIIAAAAVARLHAVPAFDADLEAARAEVAVLRGEGARPDAETCTAEAASLGNVKE